MNKSTVTGARMTASILAIMVAMPISVASAQTSAPAPAPAAQNETIRSINIVGTQRLEADTVRSYIRLRTGQVWTQATGDQALKDLYATELFADVSVRNSGAT